MPKAISKDERPPEGESPENTGEARVKITTEGGKSAASWWRWGWRFAGLVCVGFFLVLIARFYSQATGFTSLVSIGAKLGITEMPVLKATPHYTYEDSFGYDGAYYLQIALDPLLQDPALAKSVDNLPYRAKRILLSWVAWALGGGQPYWVIHIYPVLNVGSWLLLAALLWRWFPLNNAGNFLRWAGVLFSHGVCMSVRHSLVDLPSLLLVAAAVALVESGWRKSGTAMLAAATLGKETSVLALPAFLRWGQPGWRPWVGLAARGAAVGLPLLAWIAYIRWQIGPSREVGLNNFALPLVGFFEKWLTMFGEIARDGWMRPHVVTMVTVIALTVQGIFVLVRWRPQAIWWRVGLPFALLMVMVTAPVWEGYPGAASRVVLPLTLAFNVLVPAGRRWLPVLVLGNLSVFAGLAEMDPPIRDFYQLRGERLYTKSVVVERGAGWYQAESDGKKSWRWARDRATLRLTNRGAGPAAVRMSCRLAAFTDRHLGLRVNGKEIWNTPLWPAARPHEFPVIVVPPGETAVVEFATDAPSMRLENGDPRELSLCVFGLIIDVARAEPVPQGGGS